MKDQTEELLIILKTLADKSRISIFRILNQSEYSVGDLAELINLTEPTVSHHLSRLRQAGLVTLRTAGNQRFYQANQNGLAYFKKLVNEIELLPPVPQPVISEDFWIEVLGWSEEDQKVLKSHTQNGKLVRLPAKQKKMLVILRWLAGLFEAGKFYSETEVNQIIRNVHEDDYVGLRRELIDMGYLRRERGGGKYWLTPAENEPEK